MDNWDTMLWLLHLTEAAHIGTIAAQKDEYVKLGSYAMIGLPMELYPTSCAYSHARVSVQVSAFNTLK